MKRIITVLYITFFAACSSIKDKVAIPDTVLPQEKMAEVMVDVHLLEAALSVNALSRDQQIMNSIHPDSDILKKHNVTNEKYQESFTFYSQNPLLLAEVYQFVLNDLSKMQAEVMSKK